MVTMYNMGLLHKEGTVDRQLYTPRTRRAKLMELIAARQALILLMLMQRVPRYELSETMSGRFLIIKCKDEAASVYYECCDIAHTHTDTPKHTKFTHV